MLATLRWGAKNVIRFPVPEIHHPKNRKDNPISVLSDKGVPLLIAKAGEIGPHLYYPVLMTTPMGARLPAGPS